MKLPYKSRICTKKFYGKKVDCFIFDEKVNDELNLPYMAFYETRCEFPRVMWYNCEYRFYYVRKYFPDYEYYWQFEYDVYCNDDNYKPFLDKHVDKKEDLLVPLIFKTQKNTEWWWTKDIDWAYDDSTPLYGLFLPVCRLSASATDFLYKKRLEHAEMYNACKAEKKQWIECELFVSTELMNNNFTCGVIYEENIKSEEFSLKNKIFKKHDGKLYHPVKYKKRQIRINLDISKIKKRLFILSYLYFIK